jgi:hypothetical protein
VIDYETFAKIHDCHHRQGLTIAQTARVLGLHPQTVATWLKPALPRQADLPFGALPLSRTGGIVQAIHRCGLKWLGHFPRISGAREWRSRAGQRIAVAKSMSTFAPSSASAIVPRRCE